MYEQHKIDTTRKARAELLKTLLAQPGDLILTEAEKMALVMILEQLIPKEQELNKKQPA